MRITLVLSLMLAVLGAERAPLRNSTRASSFEWLPDVQERLRTLDEHAADAARERMRLNLHENSSGRFSPQPPAAGAESVR